jgi:hypothetical protein
MDVFIEQLVIRKNTARDSILKILLLISIASLSTFLTVVGIIFIALPFISFTAIAAVPGVLWLGLYFLRGLVVEYEYILTNKELDIDKITGRRKRKRMFSLDLTGTEVFDIFNNESDITSDVTISAHDNCYMNMWYLAIKSDSYGRVVLLFNPNDEFVVKLNSVLPPRVRNKKVLQSSRD